MPKVLGVGLLIIHIPSTTISLNQWQQRRSDSGQSKITSSEQIHTERGDRPLHTYSQCCNSTSGEIDLFKVNAWHKTSHILKASIKSGGDPNIKLIYNGARVPLEETVGIGRWIDDLYDDRMTRRQAGFSPEAMNLPVFLVSAPEWEFSVVCPVALITSTPLGHQVSWDVRTQLNGDLTEFTSEIDVS